MPPARLLSVLLFKLWLGTASITMMKSESTCLATRFRSIRSAATSKASSSRLTAPYVKLYAIVQNPLRNPVSLSNSTLNTQ